MKKQFLIFSDLDGSLLDHHSYDWQPARAALETIRELEIPLIFNTSKTIAEVRALQLKTGLESQPFLSENGLVSAFPGDEPEVDGLDYETIRATLNALRKEFDFKFTGFGDCSIDQIVELTGLSERDAINASLRSASEPLLWQDSDRLLAVFRALLNDAGLTLQRGGRFFHVSSMGDKGQGALKVLAKYQHMQPDTQWITVGLGDGMNDLPMLEAVDIPVLIRANHGASPDVSHLPKVIKTVKTGPAGWNETIISLLSDEKTLS